MPNWDRLIRARLSCLNLPPCEIDDVVAELAAHLEERYHQYRLEDISSEAAVKRSLEQVPDWKCFAREIQSAKKGESMNLRTRTFWLPSALTLILSMGFLLTLQFSGIQPRTVLWGNGPLLLFYIPWLVSLPVIGALGAFLSLRAGGSRQIVLLCSVFSSVYQVLLFFVILPLALVFNRNVAAHFQFSSFFPQIFAWLLLPIAALLIGGLGLLAANGGRAVSK